MFCPQCGSTQPNDLRFCKQCGAHLASVRTALTQNKPEETGKFDWNKTWLAEMMMSSEESVRRSAELDRLRGVTPETRREMEIKGGVITASVGIGLMIFLYALMGGIIASGRVDEAAAAIISKIWVVGVIPLLVGAALVFNGMFISKRSEQRSDPADEPQNETTRLSPSGSADFLPPADTNELFPAGFSVTDETTKHLKTPRQN